MAVKEEYEYLSFRCCYCYTFNNAVKLRPVAPKLAFESTVIESESSESEKQSPSDSDSDTESKRRTKAEEDLDPMSDFDKLSDLEHKQSDAMEVDPEESEKAPIENLAGV